MKITLLMMLVGCLLISCQATVDSAKRYQNETASAIYLAGKMALQNQDYNEAAKRFEALTVQYPLNSDTKQAQLYLIYAYYMKQDYSLSITTADQFIHYYPVDPQVDYAYYLRGLSHYNQNLGMLERFFAIDLARRDLTSMQTAYQSFATLYTRFPHSYYRAAAYQQRVYLRNLLASHELEVANFYYQRGAYVAAANRASNVIMQYPGAPAVFPALQLMANAYHQLKLTALEQGVLAVIQANASGEAASVPVQNREV